MTDFSTNIAEDFFLREPANARIKQTKAEIKNEPPLKVEMQTLRLKADSQKLVLETLKYIHGPDFKLGAASCYEDKGTNVKNKYWMQRGNLMVQGGFDYSLQAKPDIVSSEMKFRQFALAKLESYGFHKTHCAEALDAADNDVNKTLEMLYCKYFDIQKGKVEDPPPENQLLELRDEEWSVLESIYDSAFQVKETNHVWNVNLELDYVVKLYEKIEPKSTSKHRENLNHNSKNNNFKTKKNEVCRNFKKGSCTYGNKCRFLHETKPTLQVDDVVSKENVKFILEIRFPPGNLYPHEPPYLFLKSDAKPNQLPEMTCLKITRRLIEEAKTLAQDAIPSVYSVVELLKNEEEIISYLQFSIQFPHPSDSILPPKIDDELGLKKPLPSHYKKATNTNSRLNTDFDALYKDNLHLAKMYKDRKSLDKYKKMMESRRKLPAWSKREEILRILKSNQVTVISGETGCGKSTQVPQYILDDWLDNLHKEDSKRHAEIICTQPRRISAIGVADRVADERVERTGAIVGYQIRLENKISSKTRLTFCTTGILLRRLEYDPKLESVTHIIVDEVHERSEESDFLLLILRDLIKVRKDLSIVLMSATLNSELFSEYFDEVPVLEIPGRTFPVEQIFLEDIIERSNYVLEENSHFSRKFKKGYNYSDVETELTTYDVQSSASIAPLAKLKDEALSIAQMVARYPHCSNVTCKNLYMMDTEKINTDLIEHTLIYIVEGDHDWPREGAILVFLPGISEIMSLHDHLTGSKIFGSKSKYLLVPLHSTLSSEEQAAVFKKTKPGQRKIVLSTNIAETSVTIDDCVFVIDCGKMKEKRFDSNRNMESLDLVWVSRANARQRKGRAGRVMPGVCIHLFTSHRYDNHLLAQPVPEMHRIPLEQLVLKIKILPVFESMAVHKVLESTIEPPLKSNIDGALCRLQDIGALDKEMNLTPLGKHLASLPVDVRIGKLMLFGAIFCCLDSALTMAACLSYKNPFVAPFGKKDEADAKRREFSTCNSDQLTILKAYKKWQKAAEVSRHAGQAFANENFLSQKTLIMLGDIKHQLLSLLASIGFVPDMKNIRKKYGKDSVHELTGNDLNANGGNDRLLAAILCAALYPNVVKVLTPEKSFHASVGGAIPRQPKPDELRFKTKTDGFVALHPSSVNYVMGYFPSPILVYQEKVKTSRVFIRDCSMVPQLPLVLFSGCQLKIELHDGMFMVSLEDGWIMFQVETHEVAEMLKSIRIELINLLEEKIKDPCLNLLHHEKGTRIINTIVQIVTKD